jgi:acyl carrier protein
MSIADAVTHELAAICALAPAQVRREAMLIELGLDSIRGVELLVALESRYDLELRDDAIATVMTVGDVILMVEEQVALATGGAR